MWEKIFTYAFYLFICKLIKNLKKMLSFGIYLRAAALYICKIIYLWKVFLIYGLSTDFTRILPRIWPKFILFFKLFIYCLIMLTHSANSVASNTFIFSMFIYYCFINFFSLHMYLYFIYCKYTNLTFLLKNLPLPAYNENQYGNIDFKK